MLPLVQPWWFNCKLKDPEIWLWKQVPNLMENWIFFFFLLFVLVSSFCYVSSSLGKDLHGILRKKKNKKQRRVFFGFFLGGGCLFVCFFRIAPISQQPSFLQVLLFLVEWGKPFKCEILEGLASAQKLLPLNEGTAGGKPWDTGTPWGPEIASWWTLLGENPANNTSSEFIFEKFFSSSEIWRHWLQFLPSIFFLGHLCCRSLTKGKSSDAYSGREWRGEIWLPKKECSVGH